MKACKYGDPTCPCQDGDMCHYEGEDPMSVPAEMALKAVAAAARKAREEERERNDDLEERIGAALAVLPGQRKPHPDDGLQQLVNLARGMLEGGGSHVVYVSLLKGVLERLIEPPETIETMIEAERLRRAESAAQDLIRARADNEQA